MPQRLYLRNPLFTGRALRRFRLFECEKVLNIKHLLIRKLKQQHELADVERQKSLVYHKAELLDAISYAMASFPSFSSIISCLTILVKSFAVAEEVMLISARGT